MPPFRDGTSNFARLLRCNEKFFMYNYSAAQARFLVLLSDNLATVVYGIPIHGGVTIY